MIYLEIPSLAALVWIAWRIVGVEERLKKVEWHVGIQGENTKELSGFILDAVQEKPIVLKKAEVESITPKKDSPIVS